MYNGAPAQFLLADTEFLKNLFRKKLACRGGRVAWYGRSPDLNPLDFYLWGYLQSTVFNTEVSYIGCPKKIVPFFYFYFFLGAQCVESGVSCTDCY
jgi:hypothetical protein